MFRRIRKWLTTTSGKWWLFIGAMLGAGAMPCPECGAPLAIHFWPVAALALVVKVLRERYARGGAPDSLCEPCERAVDGGE